MGFEIRIFFRSSEAGFVLPSFLLEGWLEAGFEGLISANEANRTREELKCQPERRVDTYIALPQPYGHLVGLKGRGSNEKKVEVKYVSGASLPSDDLQPWNKLTSKVKPNGIHNMEGTREFLAGNATASELIQWACANLGKEPGEYARRKVLAVKARRSGWIGGLAFEETDVTFVVQQPDGTSRSSDWRSWAAEAAPADALRRVSAQWQKILKEALTEKAECEVCVLSYPAMVQFVWSNATSPLSSL